MSFVNEFVGEVPGKEEFLAVEEDVAAEEESKEDYCLQDWQGKEAWLC